MRLIRLGFVMCITAALALGGCRDGGGDDDDVQPDGGMNGGDGGNGGTTIYDIQEGRVAPGTLVTLENVVVSAVDLYGSRTGGVYVQEAAGGAYSGVFVFGATLPGGAPIDTLVPGDIVTVSGGVVEEFSCAPCTTPFPDGQSLTEISGGGGMVLITKTGSGAAPQPTVVDPVMLAASATEAEKWEGVLITVENVAAVENLWTSTSDPTIQEIDVTGPFPVGSSLTSLADLTIERDDCFASVTGIGDYFYDYKIHPRSAADVVAGSMSACVYENDATMCGNAMDDDHDGFTDCADFSCQTIPSCVADATIQDVQMGTIPVGTRVTLTDVVVTAKASSLVWVQDPAGGEYSGVAVFPSAPPAAALVPGTIVTVEGNVDEFFCVTEIEMATITVTGTGTPLAPLVIPDPATLADVGPAPVPPSECAGPGTAEPYEGVLVRVEDVSVVSAPDMYGQWGVGTGVGLLVDNMMYTPMPAPAVDDCYSQITGVLHFSFDEFKLQPRNAADATVGAGCP